MRKKAVLRVTGARLSRVRGSTRVDPAGPICVQCLAMRRALVLGVLGLCLIAPAVRAQPVDEGARSAVRELGRAGLEAYKAGKYAEALEAFSRAYSVLKLPSIGLYTARCLEKLGRLAEASERYLEVTRLPVGAGEASIQEEAKAKAEQERAALEARVPRVTVTLEGPGADQAEVLVDGAPVARALVGVPRAVNPGSHRIEARVGDRVVTETATLGEGESKTVVLKLPEAPAAGPAEPVAAPQPPPAEPPAAAPRPPPPELAAPARDQGSAPGSVQRTAGWVSIGLGGAGLVLGTVTGIMVLSRKSDLDASGCVDAACYTDQADDVDAMNGLRPISTVGFVIAGVGLAAGVTLLLTAPKQPQSVSLWLGPSSAALRGRF